MAAETVIAANPKSLPYSKKLLHILVSTVVAANNRLPQRWRYPQGKNYRIGVQRVANDQSFNQETS